MKWQTMKISRKSEYAILALVELAAQKKEAPTPISEISKKVEIPEKFLEQIMILLRQARYVKSFRGPEGGYALAKGADKISVAEIIRLIDGALAPVRSASVYFYERSPIQENKQLMKIFKDIREYVSDKLEKTSIQDLV